MLKNLERRIGLKNAQCCKDVSSGIVLPLLLKNVTVSVFGHHFHRVLMEQLEILERQKIVSLMQNILCRVYAVIGLILHKYTKNMRKNGVRGFERF